MVSGYSMSYSHVFIHGVREITLLSFFGLWLPSAEQKIHIGHYILHGHVRLKSINNGIKFEARYRDQKPHSPDGITDRWTGGLKD